MEAQMLLNAEYMIPAEALEAVRGKLLVEKET